MPNQTTLRSALRLPALAALTLALFALLSPAAAQAQIKQPGAHPKYSVELDPHIVFGFDGPFHNDFDDEGFGLGFRASIPIVEQGPIKTINNSMAIGFGGDWLFYGEHDCRWGGRRWYFRDCSGSVLYFPVVLQWNFWLTPKISVFGEPGLTIRHTRVSYEYDCGGGNICDDDDSDTDFIPFILWGGGRFLLGDSVGITVRLGWPYVAAGVSILL